MILLLTGANGLIGQKIIRELSTREDIRVIATSKGYCRFVLPENVTYEPYDITDKDRGAGLIKLYRPDFIFNTAAITQADDCELNPEKCHRVNVGAVEHMADLSQSFHSFLLHFSTDFVFNGNRGPYREEDLPDPVSEYGRSKWEAEKIIMNSLKEYAIVRIILVYGYLKSAPRKNLVTWVLDSLQKKENIRVVADQVRNPTLAEDVVIGCRSILEKKLSGIFHLGGKDTLSPYEMAIRTARYFNLDQALIKKVSTSDFPQPAKRPLITGLITEKAEKLLDYHPRDFEEGLKIIKEQAGID